MGNLFTYKKKSINNKLNLINFNSCASSNSIHNKSIFLNFIESYKNKNIILCGQGFRDFDIEELNDDNNYYINNELGLLTYTNLPKKEYYSKKFNDQSKFDSRIYGFIKNKINYFGNQLVIYNTEIISNNLFNNLNLCNEVKKNQIQELIHDIYKFDCKINIIFAYIHSYDNKIKKLINISKFNEIKKYNNDSYIFIYSRKFIDNSNFNIEGFLNNEYKIELIEENIFNYDDSFPFEIVLKLKKNCKK
jgi:hypothetical protein